MQSIELTALGTGFLVNGGVVLAHEDGAKSIVSADDILENGLTTGWHLATEAEAEALALELDPEPVRRPELPSEQAPEPIIEP